MRRQRIVVNRQTPTPVLGQTKRDDRNDRFLDQVPQQILRLFAVMEENRVIPGQFLRRLLDITTGWKRARGETSFAPRRLQERASQLLDIRPVMRVVFRLVEMRPRQHEAEMPDGGGLRDRPDKGARPSMR